MSTSILLVSHDLDFHELLKDIVSITYRNSTIEKALDFEKLEERLSAPACAYDLILMDAHFVESEGRDAISLLREKYPAMLSRLVLVADTADPSLNVLTFGSIPVIGKPFSLDVFDQIVKQIHDPH